MRRDPLPYTAETAEDDHPKGKQIYTQPSKLGRTPDTYFEKKHLYIAEVCFHDLEECPHLRMSANSVM